MIPVTVTKISVDARFAALHEFRWNWTQSIPSSSASFDPVSFQQHRPLEDKMPKDTSGKKSKKSKEVTETVEESIVTGADVEMDVEVAKVCMSAN